MPLKLANATLRCIPSLAEREVKEIQNLFHLPKLLGVWNENFETKVLFLAGGLKVADGGSNCRLDDVLGLEDSNDHCCLDLGGLLS